MFDSIAGDKPEEIYLEVFFLFSSYDMFTKILPLIHYSLHNCNYINLIVYSMYHRQVEFLMESII